MSTSRLIIVVLILQACVIGLAQRLPRPVGLYVSDRTLTSCLLTWKNPRQVKYSKFQIMINPSAKITYPEDRSQTYANIEDLIPGLTYSIRLKGMTDTMRSSTPTSFPIWSEPYAPTGLSIKTLEGLRLKISLGRKSQDFTAKVVGAQVEWNPVKISNALLGYETQIYPDEGTIVYPDDMLKQDSVLIYTGLTPGREYTLSLRTKIGPPYDLVYSQPISTTFIMPPAIPYDVSINAVGSSHVTLKTINVFGESDGVEFDFFPNHGKIGDSSPDPVAGSYNLYTITKLMPSTDYVVNTYAVSQGVRSTRPFIVHFTTDPSDQVDIDISDFTSTSVTLSIEESNRLKATEEYVIQYTDVNDPESYLETETFFYDSSNSLVNVRIGALNPGVTYRFGVIRAPFSEYPEYVGEIVQTTIPERPLFVSLEPFESGVKVEYGEPDDGDCPLLKIYTSPGDPKEMYRVKSRLHSIGEPVFLPNVPTDKRYSVHARCVSSGIEGEETVVESFDRNEIRSDKKQANLACKELRKSDERLINHFPKTENNSNSSSSSSSSSGFDSEKPDACCGPRPYRTKTESCCGESLLRINGDPKKLCCGDLPYNAIQKVCCEGSRIVPRSVGCEVEIL